MTTPPLHVCIATGQNLANLIPALQCAATQAWVLRTPAMRASAAHLAGALKARGIDVHIVDFADDAVTTLHAQAEAIAERLDGRAVTINLTGGTKLMTLALVQTLAEHLKTAPKAEPPHLLYMDTVHRRLDWLAPAPCSEPMRSVLRIDDILLAQGYRRRGGTDAAEWQRRAEDRGKLTRFMGENARPLGRFFGTLNHLAQLALNELHGPWRREQQFEFAPGHKYAELLRSAQQQGLLHWDGDTQIVFHDRAAAAYIGGSWVEEYAGFKISGMKPGGWSPCLEIQHVDSGATNEIDAVAVHGNRLLAVECKAARGADDKVADWIYKANQLARSVGGHLAQPLLLSARLLNPEHHQRAREYGVDVLDGAELARLPEYLRGWMAGD